MHRSDPRCVWPSREGVGFRDTQDAWTCFPHQKLRAPGDVASEDFPVQTSGSGSAQIGRSWEMTTKRASLKFNAVLNTTRTLIALGIPLISFPYLSRVLGPTGVGWVNFSVSFAGYFVMLAGLGIPYYGIREVSSTREMPIDRAQRVQELFWMHMFASLAFFLVLLMIVLLHPNFLEQRTLFLVSGAGILFSALAMEWYYQGREEYLYITTRSLAFSVASLLAMFAMVRESGHYLRYALILMAVSLGTGIVNSWGARKDLFSRRKEPLRFRRHWKAMGSSYAILIVSSLYLNLDVVLLGFLCDPENVGFYTTATRLLTIVWTLVSSFGTVLVPRLSYYSESGRTNEFDAAIGKSIQMTLILSIPAIAGVLFLKRDIVEVFAGERFQGAVLPLAIVMPGLFLASLSNIFAWQILFPKKQELRIVISMGLAAVVSLGANFWLIPAHAEVGAAASKLLAESVVCVALYFQARKICRFRVGTLRGWAGYTLGTGLMLLFLAGVGWGFDGSVYIRLPISVVGGAMVYVGTLIMCKEPLVRDGLGVIYAKINRSRSR